MSLKYRNSQGVETPVAGLNGQNGNLVPSVALKQNGTETATNIPANAWINTRITFATPMPDADYVVVADENSNGYVAVDVLNKTANGFTAFIYNRADSDIASTTITWSAFKLMTDTVHEADSAHIAQNTANFAPAFSDTVSYAVGDYVTYNNVLYRCTTAHTAGVWVAGHFTQVTVGGELETKELTNITVAYGHGKAWRSGNTVTVAWATENDTSVSIPIAESTLISGLPRPKVEDLAYWNGGNPYAPMYTPGGNGVIDPEVAANVTRDGDLVVYNGKGASVSGAYRGFYITYLTSDK